MIKYAKQIQFKYNSNESITFQPKVVTDIDEAELAKRLEQHERENEEVPGDDDEEEDGEYEQGDVDGNKDGNNEDMEVAE